MNDDLITPASQKDAVFKILADHAKSISVNLSAAPTIVISWAPGIPESPSYITVGALDALGEEPIIGGMQEALIALQSVKDRTEANLKKLMEGS